MEAHKLGTTLFGIVAVLALTGLILTYHDSSGLAVYEQPGNHLPLYEQTSVYLEHFNLCMQYFCSAPPSFGYGEAVPAQQIGIDDLTGNLRCGCPDGHEFYIRPDYISPGVPYGQMEYP